MPELPEIEVTRRCIAPHLLGRRIRRATTTSDSYVFLTGPRVLRGRLRGRTFRELSRHGKYLVADLDDGRRLLIHLGMTGQLFCAAATSVRLLAASTRLALSPEEQPQFRPDTHTHLRLEFDDPGPDVFFRDVRKFGKLMLLEPGQSTERLDRLGPDALEVHGDLLFRASRKRAVPIKQLLLDQSLIAGVGNIYADEALFLSGVRPGRRAARLTRSESDKLAKAVVRVLRRSIETGGSSIRDYVAPDGSDGSYQLERHVYARTGEPCFRCGSPIRKRVIAQRGTHYCPSCQS
ncbi:MAG: bifunctional DNA-formamidopyrimidine glycosylase/DNA-(apurinic or apyrimidinic site) lyase [Myxococcota bacterium]